MKLLTRRAVIAFATLVATLVIRAIDKELWRECAWLLKELALALLGVGV